MRRRVESKPLPPPRGLLFLVTAPSGAGKDSVIDVLRRRGVDLAFAVTAVTRQPRAGEVDGVHHFFLTDAQFDARREQGWFLETANVYGRRYGTPLHQVRGPLRAGRDVVLRLDVQGARALKRRYPAAVAVFVEPPSPAEAERRMRSRATESCGEIARRVAAMRGYELAFAREADARIVNATGGLEHAADRLWDVVTACRQDPARRLAAASLAPAPADG